MINRKNFTKEEIEDILSEIDLDEEEDEDADEFMGRQIGRLDVDIKRSDSQYHGTTWHDDI